MLASTTASGSLSAQAVRIDNCQRQCAAAGKPEAELQLALATCDGMVIFQVPASAVASESVQ
jgi:hypothetical protein